MKRGISTLTTRPNRGPVNRLDLTQDDCAQIVDAMSRAGVTGSTGDKDRYIAIMRALNRSADVLPVPACQGQRHAAA